MKRLLAVLVVVALVLGGLPLWGQAWAFKIVTGYVTIHTMFPVTVAYNASDSGPARVGLLVTYPGGSSRWFNTSVYLAKGTNLVFYVYAAFYGEGTYHLALYVNNAKVDERDVVAVKPPRAYAPSSATCYAGYPCTIKGTYESSAPDRVEVNVGSNREYASRVRGVLYQNGTWIITFTPNFTGTYTALVMVYDKAGAYASAYVSVQVKAPASPPQPSVSSTSYNVGYATIVVSIPGKLLYCNATSTDSLFRMWNMFFNASQASITLFAPGKTVTLNLTAVNGTSTTTVTVTVSVPPIPTATINDVPNVTVGSTVTVTGSCTNATGVLWDVILGSDRVFNRTALCSQGQYSFSFIANSTGYGIVRVLPFVDWSGTRYYGSRTVSVFTVAYPNQAPGWTQIGGSESMSYASATRLPSYGQRVFSIPQPPHSTAIAPYGIVNSDGRILYWNGTIKETITVNTLGYALVHVINSTHFVVVSPSNIYLVDGVRAVVVKTVPVSFANQAFFSVYHYPYLLIADGNRGNATVYDVRTMAKVASILTETSSMPTVVGVYTNGVWMSVLQEYAFLWGGPSLQPHLVYWTGTALNLFYLKSPYEGITRAPAAMAAYGPYVVVLEDAGGYASLIFLQVSPSGVSSLFTVDLGMYTARPMQLLVLPPWAVGGGCDFAIIVVINWQIRLYKVSISSKTITLVWSVSYTPPTDPYINAPAMVLATNYTHIFVVDNALHIYDMAGKKVADVALQLEGYQGLTAFTPGGNNIANYLGTNVAWGDTFFVIQYGGKVNNVNVYRIGVIGESPFDTLKVNPVITGPPVMLAPPPGLQYVQYRFNGTTASSIIVTKNMTVTVEARTHYRSAKLTLTFRVYAPRITIYAPRYVWSGRAFRVWGDIVPGNFTVSRVELSVGGARFLGRLHSWDALVTAPVVSQPTNVTITATVFDVMGYSSSASAVVTVLPLPKPPVVTLQVPAQVYVNQTVVVNGTVDGYNVTGVEVVIPELNIRTWAPIRSPFSVVFTPNKTGTVTVTATATDPFGQTGSASATVNVVAPPQPSAVNATQPTPTQPSTQPSQPTQPTQPSQPSMPRQGQPAPYPYYVPPEVAGLLVAFAVLLLMVLAVVLLILLAKKGRREGEEVVFVFKQ